MTNTQEQPIQETIKTESIWYILSKIQNNKFVKATRGEIYFETLEQAIAEKDKLESLRNERIYILERTCKVVL